MVNLDSSGFAAGNVAVITGGADGIGLACATRFAAIGMQVMLADIDTSKLEAAHVVLINGGAKGANLGTFTCDVAERAHLDALATETEIRFGPVAVLMNNAAIGANPGAPWENGDGWAELLRVNFTGVVNGVQAFAPAMIASGSRGVIINTGSKQGITRPPGNAAYNVAKSAVLAYTEMLEHALRSLRERGGCDICAHLLIPGFTYTGMIRRHVSEKPESAWTPEQVADFMLHSIMRGDFYILCPDNDVDRQTDEKRMAWTMGDIIHNRPPLSRWHADYTQEFEAYMQGD